MSVHRTSVNSKRVGIQGRLRTANLRASGGNFGKQNQTESEE